MTNTTNALSLEIFCVGEFIKMIGPVDTEVESITQIANLYIKQSYSDTLPKELHDALNNIFTKGHKKSEDTHVSNSSTLEYRKAVISTKEVQFSKRVEHRVIRGRRATVYNALCLYSLIGTAGTKKVFQDYYIAKLFTDKREFKLLDEFAKKELSTEMLFFGVSQSSFDNIKSKLLDKNFDLFTNQLPSPFQRLKADDVDLSPLSLLYDRGINWQSVIETYTKSDKKFKSKEYIEAQNILQKVADKRLLKLPLFKELSANIDSQINENNEAWEYLQNILN